MVIHDRITHSANSVHYNALFAPEHNATSARALCPCARTYKPDESHRQRILRASGMPHQTNFHMTGRAITLRNSCARAHIVQHLAEPRSMPRGRCKIPIGSKSDNEPAHSTQTPKRTPSIDAISDIAETKGRNLAASWTVRFDDGRQHEAYTQNRINSVTCRAHLRTKKRNPRPQVDTSQNN